MRDSLYRSLEDIKLNRNVNGPQIRLIKDFDTEDFARPTHIETNEFTWPFQEIVNTYGVP